MDITCFSTIPTTSSTHVIITVFLVLIWTSFSMTFPSFVLTCLGCFFCDLLSFLV
jgi:hypothetical protein